MGADFLNVAYPKIKPSANCRTAHMFARYTTPFAVKSTCSKTDCGEKQIDKLTIISINEKSPDTMSIHLGKVFCVSVINSLGVKINSVSEVRIEQYN